MGEVEPAALFEGGDAQVAAAFELVGGEGGLVGFFAGEEEEGGGP